MAIPALIGYRYLRGRVDGLVVEMEKEAIALVEALQRKQYIDNLGRSPSETAAQNAAQNAGQIATKSVAPAGSR